jgi:hypothetical protein
MDNMVLKGFARRAGVHIDGNYVKSLLGNERRLESGRGELVD